MIYRILLSLLFLCCGSKSFGQVKSILLDDKGNIVTDTASASSYAVFGKLDGDSVYMFNKFDFDGTLLTSGAFKDEQLTVPHGEFVYYDWIAPEYTYSGMTGISEGKARFINLTGNFVDGRREGKWFSFYQDGKIKELASFTRSELNGAYQQFTNDGKVQVSGNYISGKKNGTWVLRGGKQEDEYHDDKVISSLTGKKLREKQTKQ